MLNLCQLFWPLGPHSSWLLWLSTIISPVCLAHQGISGSSYRNSAPDRNEPFFWGILIPFGEKWHIKQQSGCQRCNCHWVVITSRLFFFPQKQGQEIHVFIEREKILNSCWYFQFKRKIIVFYLSFLILCAFCLTLRLFPLNCTNYLFNFIHKYVSNGLSWWLRW